MSVATSERTGNRAPEDRTMNRRAGIGFAAFGIAALAACAPIAVSADPTVDVSVGTLGAAASISRPLNAETTLRFTYGTWQFARTAAFDNLVIDVTARLRLNESFRVQTAGFYVERRLRGPLSLVGGALLNLNTIDAVSVPADQSITIGGVVYPENTAGVIFTHIRWNPVAPYVGISLTPAQPAAHASFFVQLGAYYQGKARVTFDATGAILANQTTFQPYYDNERAQLTSELGPFQFYPVVQLGMRFRT